MNITNVVGALAFAAALLISAGWRAHAHDKMPRPAIIGMLAGAMAITLSAAVWWPGLYQWTDHGLGLVVLGAGFAGFLVDFICQVILKHEKFDKKRTSYIAVGLGITGMLVFGNLSHVTASLGQVTHGGNVTQLFSTVHKGGK